MHKSIVTEDNISIIMYYNQETDHRLERYTHKYNTQSVLGLFLYIILLYTVELVLVYRT